MRKKLAAIAAVILALALFSFPVLATEAPSDPPSKEELQQEYKDANVVLDFYCLAILNNGVYELTDAFSGLDISKKDGETDADFAKRIAQAGVEIVKADGSTAVPAYPSMPLDQLIKDMPLGMYLVIPHGSDLEMKDYFKKIKDEDGNEVYVSIAQTPDYEYRFSPILATTSYETPDLEFEVKAEKVNRYGNVKIVKTLNTYETSGPVTFGFHIKAVKDGQTVFEDYAGLTFNGPGRDSVEIYRIPAEAVVTVDEIYSRQAYAQISDDPEPVTVQPGKTVTVLIGGEDSGNEDSFVNDYTNPPPPEDGYGMINRFEYDAEGKTWKWYKNGELMN